jgi:two-component system cell cycle response regulator
MSKLQGLFITPFTEDLEDNSKVSNMELESGFLYISDNLHNLDAYTVFSDLVKQGKPG